MQRVSRTASIIGLLPWVLATLVYVAQFTLADGGEGLRIALRDTVTLPLIVAPVIASVLFEGLRRSAKHFGSDAVTRSVVLAVAMCGGMTAFLLALGLATSDGDGVWAFVGWGILSLYLPLLTLTSAVHSYRGATAARRDYWRNRSLRNSATN